MKKVLVIIMTIAMAMSLCSCGGGQKKAFDESKAAYDSIDVAYEVAEAFGTDLYEAWRLGIYEDDEILDDGVSYLAKELSLSEDELNAGIAKFMEDDEPEYNYDYLFEIFEEDLFSFCIEIVVNSYEANGKIEVAENALKQAKNQMKTLSEKYSDYEHYPNLKGYFTTTSSFFDFCQNPSGSFEQVKTTINDYKNEVRDYISDLDYIFED